MIGVYDGVLNLHLNNLCKLGNFDHHNILLSIEENLSDLQKVAPKIKLISQIKYLDTIDTTLSLENVGTKIPQRSTKLWEKGFSI